MSQPCNYRFAAPGQAEIVFNVMPTASLLIAKGYDLKRVQEWLRHKEIGTTMNIYGHLAFDDKKYTADAMTNILAQQKEE